MKRFKILFLAPNQIERYNIGHQLFRNAVGKLHDVVYWGPGFEGYEPIPVTELIRRFGPFDFVGTYFWKNCSPKVFPRLDHVKNVKKFHVVLDLVEQNPDYPRNHINYNQIAYNKTAFNNGKYDFYFCFDERSVRLMKELKIPGNVYFLPFSVDTDYFCSPPEDRNRSNDILFLGSSWEELYPNRKKIRKLLDEKGIKFFGRRILFREYVVKLEDTKIVLNSTNRWKTANLKIYEAMSCGAMMMTDVPEDFEVLGFIPYKHYVPYNKIDEIPGLLDKYLKNKKERERIAKAGQEFVRSSHSTLTRVKQMTKILEEENGNGNKTEIENKKE